MKRHSRIKPPRLDESFAEHGLAKWMQHIADRSPRDPQAARELASALRLIVSAYAQAAASVNESALDEAAAVATRQMVRVFESMPRRFSPFAACWPDFPALVPLRAPDRKFHLTALERDLQAGTHCPGARARSGAKSASLLTPINRLAKDLADGVLRYRGREYLASYAWPSLSHKDGLATPKATLPSFPCPPDAMRRAMDAVLMPFVKSIVKHPRNFRYVSGLTTIDKKHAIRKSGKTRGADWKAPDMESAARDAWNRAHTKLSAAFVRLGYVKSA